MGKARERKRIPVDRVRALPLILVASLTLGCAGGPSTGPEAEPTLTPEQAAVEAERRGDQAVRTGDLDKALFEYVKAAEAKPKAVLLGKIGEVQLMRDDLPLASDAFRESLALDPEFVDAREGLGLVLVRLRRYEEAETYLREAAEADTTRWRAFDALGVLADLSGDGESAESSYLKAMALRPNDPKILNNYGYSKYLRGELDTAARYFQRVLELSPDNRNAWSNLGLVYARQERYEDSLVALRKVMSEPEAYNTLGYLCMADRKYDQAEHFLREALERSPSYYPEAQENLRRLQNLRSRYPVTDAY